MMMLSTSLYARLVFWEGLGLLCLLLQLQVAVLVLEFEGCHQIQGELCCPEFMNWGQAGRPDPPETVFAAGFQLLSSLTKGHPAILSAGWKTLFPIPIFHYSPI